MRGWLDILAGTSDLTMRETIKLCCIVALTLSGCAVLLEASSLLREVRRDERKIADDTETLIATAQRASDAAYAAETKQIATLERTSAEFYKLTAAARLVLVRSDRSLNDQLAPRIAAAVDSASELAKSSAADIHGIALQAGSSFAATNELLSSAASLVGNGHIPATLEHLDTGTASLADSAKQLNGVATDAKNLADYEVKQLETPEKVWLSILKFVLGYGASARGLFVGYK